MTSRYVRCSVGLVMASVVIVLLAPTATIASVEEATGDLERGETESAIIRLKDLVQREPANAHARLLLGQIYLENLQPRAAEMEVMRARDKGASDALTRAALAESLALQGETTRALEWAEVPPDATAEEKANILALRGTLLLRQESRAEAAEAFEAALASDDESLLALLGSASMAIEDGDTETARDTINRAIRLHPDASKAWRALGMLEQREGNSAAAVEALTRAIKHARVKWPLHYARAELYVESGQAEAAAADISAVEAARVAFPAVSYLRGRLALMRGDNASAVNLLERFLRAAPRDPRGIYYTAVALQREGRNAQAEQYLSDLSARIPDNAEVRKLLARTRLGLNDALGAERAIRELAESTDADPMALELLRQSLVRQGRTDEAAAVMDRAAEQYPELSSTQIMQAWKMQATGDLVGSIALLQQVVEAEPENAQAQLLLLRALLASKNIDAALAAAADYTAAAPESPLAHTVKGAVLQQASDLDGARQAYDKALALDPAYPPAAIVRAAMEMQEDNLTESRRFLEELLSADPDNIPGTLARARLAEREGGVSAYDARLRQALERNPEALQLRLALAQSYLDAGEPTEARALLNLAPSADKQATDFLQIKAQAEVLANDLSAARATLTTLAERLPSRARYRYALAIVYAEAGDLASAAANLEQGLQTRGDDMLGHDQLAQIIAAYPTDEARSDLLERMLQIAPRDKALQAARANTLVAQGAADEGIEQLRELTTTHPDDSKVAEWLARAIYRSGDSPGAQQVLRDWLRQHGDAPNLRRVLAGLNLAENDDEGAIEQYRLILDRDADNFVALNNMAMLLSEKDPDAAMEYADRALALKPDNPIALDTKGAVLIARGDFQAGAEVLAQAYSITRNPTIALRYAEALAGAGDTRLARRVLLELRGSSPTNAKSVDAMLNRISSGD